MPKMDKLAQVKLLKPKLNTQIPNEMPKVQFKPQNPKRKAHSLIVTPNKLI
jgi:hypothetical protein